jgi:hypothetical protein
MLARGLFFRQRPEGHQQAILDAGESRREDSARSMLPVSCARGQTVRWSPRRGGGWRFHLVPFVGFSSARRSDMHRHRPDACPTGRLY